MKPIKDQLHTFYGVVRQAVMFPSYITFVEFGQNGNLVYITPTGEARNYE